MASSSLPCTAHSPFIHMTEATQSALSPTFLHDIRGAMGVSVAPRGEGMEIKGKGRMQTHCLAKT